MPIRDDVSGFELSDQFLRGFANELTASNYLWHGLELLAGQVAAAEAVAVKSLNLPDNVHGFYMGRIDGVNYEVLTCCFHWYATTACNMVRMIGWLRNKQDPTAPSALHYVKEVLPAAYPWRNKVSAHFARHSPRPDEQKADELLSVICPTTFSGRTFEAGQMAMYVRSGGKSSRSTLQAWCVSSVHSQLRQRYGLKAKEPAPQPAPT